MLLVVVDDIYHDGEYYPEEGYNCHNDLTWVIINNGSRSIGLNSIHHFIVDNALYLIAVQEMKFFIQNRKKSQITVFIDCR